MTTNLLGRRAVYTRVTHKWDEAKKVWVEESRRLFHGEIVGMGFANEDARVVMLYDDGALGVHPVESVTVEAKREEPFR